MQGQLPKDPVMLLSYVNTKLRDEYSSLQEFCLAADVSAGELKQKLAGIDYHYDETANRFI